MQPLKSRPRNVRDYQEELIRSLKDPIEAAAYLSTHLQGEHSDDLLQLALKNLLEAFE